jgi:hypothetical protein
MNRAAIWWRSLPPASQLGYALAVLIAPLGFLIGLVLLLQQNPDAVNIIVLSVLVGLFFFVLISTSSG